MASLFLRGNPLLLASSPVDIRAVLFDKDGTMSRSEPHLHALANLRIQHCLSLVESSKRGELSLLLQRVYGVHFSDTSIDPAGITAVAARDQNLHGTAVALTLAGYGWPEALALAEESFRRADQESPSEAAGTRMTEGLVDFLAALGRFGVLCAVISNDGLEGIQGFLAHHHLSGQIAAIRSADQRPRKPDPRAVHELCDELEILPSQCALIGDANSDLHMARSAGVGLVMGYRGGWQQPVPLEQSFLQLDHWQELSVAESAEPHPGVSTATRNVKVAT